MYPVVKMSFQAEVARDVGTDAAIILENIIYWVAKNEANETNFHEGRYWTYNTVSAFAKLFTWLSEPQIKRILKKLEDFDYIVTGKFSENPTNQTKYYSINTFSKVQNRTIEITESENRMDDIGKSNNKNTNNKQTNNKHINKREKKNKCHWSERQLSNEDIQDAADKTGVSFEAAAEVYEAVKDFCDSNNREYSDYNATLRNFIRRNLQKIKYQSMKDNAHARFKTGAYI